MSIESFENGPFSADREGFYLGDDIGSFEPEQPAEQSAERPNLWGEVYRQWGPGVEKALEKTGNWLGEAYYDTGYPVLSVADTALTLGSGLTNMTASAAAAIPTMLKSDDPFTKKGSKDWRAKLVETSQKLEPYRWEPKTDLAKGVSNFMSSAGETWDEKVVYPAGEGMAWVARNILGLDQEGSERAAAGVVGVLSGVKGAPAGLRFSSRPSYLPTGTGGGWSKVDIINARKNAIANVQSGRYLENTWKEIDPVGYELAVIRGTALAKLTAASEQMSWGIAEIPVDVHRKRHGPVGWNRLPPEGRNVLGYFYDGMQPLDEAGHTSKIGLLPKNMRKTAREIEKEYGLKKGTRAMDETLPHEFSHYTDALNYLKFVPTTAKMREQGIADRMKMFYGKGSVDIQPVNNLVNILEDAVMMDNVSKTRAAERAKRLEEGVEELDTDWYPGPFRDKEAWMESARKTEEQFTSPTEVHSRLHSLQKVIAEKNIDFVDLIDFKSDHRVWSTVANEMPHDVLQLLDNIERNYEWGLVPKDHLIRSLVQALESTRVQPPRQYSVGLIGKKGPKIPIYHNAPKLGDWEGK